MYLSFYQVQDRYLEDGNDKLKLLVLLCGEDDESLQIAAGGALAMLTAVQKKLCTKLTLVVSGTWQVELQEKHVPNDGRCPLFPENTSSLLPFTYQFSSVTQVIFLNDIIY